MTAWYTTRANRHGKIESRFTTTPASAVTRAERIDRAPLLDQIIHECPCLWRGKPGRLEQQMDRRRRRLMALKNALQTACREFVPDLPERDPDDSGAFYCRRHQGVEAVYPESGSYRDLGFGRCAIREAPIADAGSV